MSKKSNKFEGVKELVGLVVILATGLLEKARGTPQTLNEERKARERTNAKVEYTYGATASLSLATSSPGVGTALVRCVKT